jgi:type I restriction enzyme S subunit
MQTLKLTKKYETYSEYKDSGIEWLGEIPREWGVLKGKFVFKNKKEINVGMKNDNVLSLTMSGVINRDPSNNEGLLPSDYQSFQIFEKDDIVFKLIDLENYKTSRVGIVHEKGIMSPVYIRLEA